MSLFSYMITAILKDVEMTLLKYRTKRGVGGLLPENNAYGDK